jgi:CheY-like chemotaxis protein
MTMILLVEDDDDVREAVAEVLREHGYDVAWAADGAEAMRALRSGLRPSAILLDLMMPVMDGFAFRAEQRSDPALAPIPVIVVSAGRSLERDACALGAAARIEKPARVEDLLATIARVAGAAPEAAARPR